jgi:RHS repeat-associated protein
MHKKSLSLAWKFIIAFAVAAILPVAALGQDEPDALGGDGDDNPTGVSGIYNGNVATGCSYDPHTGNAMRVVDDIVVPGSIGAYPLKWTRYFNSHCTYHASSAGGRWRFAYLDYSYDAVGIMFFPDGRALNSRYPLYGVPEFTEGGLPTGQTLHLADGGRVILPHVDSNYLKASKIIDPYGFETTIAQTTDGKTKITEPGLPNQPGKRYLLITYNHYAEGTPNHILDGTVSQVQAFDGVSSTPIQTVIYTWIKGSGTSYPNGPYALLTHVNYGDGTAADYQYVEAKYKGAPECPGNPEGTPLFAAVLSTCDDARFAGPMCRIAYQYQDGKNKTRIESEHRLGGAGETVSSVSETNATSGGATETRGDGPTRTFHYHPGCHIPLPCWTPPPQAPEGGCGDPEPLDGKLTDYTDFYTGSISNAHTTYLSYEEDSTKPSAGYITAVTDANGTYRGDPAHTTTYTRSDYSWGITQITYPPTPSEPQGSFIRQAFTDDQHPYFLQWREDERQNKVVYTRNSPIPNAITRKDYYHQDGTLVAFETFDYNERGQTTTHRMKNGAYQYFDYDTRGLLVTKTNPTWNSSRANSLASDPRTTYTYYTISDFGGAWTDRVKTETDPRGNVTEFEYDRQMAGGENSGASGALACAGRGLVTKIYYRSDTHGGAFPNGTTKVLAFDKYGNKKWEQNEAGAVERTSYLYDEYNRVTSVTDPLSHSTLYNYKPWATGTTSYHTTWNKPFVTTLPTNEVTNTYYDVNWRKHQVQEAPSSVNANTYFEYDPVGNLTQVKDPNNHITYTDYDARNRKSRVRDAATPAHETLFGYDPAGNVISIQRSDGTIEYKTYDALNRVLTDTVPKSANENVVTTFEYYPVSNGTMVGELWHVKDGKNQTTTFEYDPSGQKTKMMYPSSAPGQSNPNDYQAWTYDANKNVVARRTVKDEVWQYFTYDARNRPTSMSWSNAADWTSFGYDAVGRMTSADNPNSTVTREYDHAGRLTHDRQKPRLQPVSAVSRKWHGGGPDATPCEVVLPLTGSAGVECRAPGPNNSHQIVVMFPRAVTFSAASVTGAATILGTPVIGAGGKQITIDLTGVNNGQLVVVTLSGVNDGTITNDVKIGMAVLLGDVNGNGTVNSSDVSQVQFESGHAVTQSTFRNDVTLSNSINSTDVSTVQAQSGTGSPLVLPAQPLSTAPEVDVQYGYDDSNRQTGLSVPGAGYNYTFGYDTMGRFETISSGGTVNFQYGYDTASNETLRRRAAGGASSVEFDQVYIPDALNRVTRRNLVRAGSTRAYEIYDYDPLRPGLMTSVTRSQPGQNPNQDVFGYDLLPELSTAQYGLQQGTGNGGEEPFGVIDPIAFGDGSKEGGDGGGEKLIEPDANLQWVQPQRTVDYTWDKAGNRSNMNENITGGASTSTPYQVTNLNQHSQAGTDAVTNGGHHELANYQDTAYSYINDTHLCAVTGDGHTYQLSYDALGRCVVRMFDGVTNYYIYDGEKAILEYSIGYNLLAANLYGRGIDEILMRTDYSETPAHTWYYQDDHEGSITQLTDTNGNIVESYRYDAFGKPAFWNADNQHIPGTNFKNRFLFTGREYMATFGIYEYRNRAYHPGLGRFMSEDPKLFDAGDYNLFRYCANDPLDHTDPMGLDITHDEVPPAMRDPNLGQNDLAAWVTHISCNTNLGAQAKNAEPNGGVKVTGQVQGGMLDPRLLQNVKKGEPNDREAPTGLELQPKKTKDHGHFKEHHLQVKHGKSDLRGKGWAVEKVEKISGNLGLETSGPRSFANGDVPDRVGPKLPPGKDVTGDLVTRQTYRIYYGFPSDVRYYDMPQVFKQHTHIEQGTVTAADVTPW